MADHSLDEAKTSFDEGKTSEALPLLTAASPSPQAKFIPIYVAGEVTGEVEVNEETTFEQLREIIATEFNADQLPLGSSDFYFYTEALRVS